MVETDMHIVGGFFCPKLDQNDPPKSEFYTRKTQNRRRT